MFLRTNSQIKSTMVRRALKIRICTIFQTNVSGDPVNVAFVFVQASHRSGLSPHPAVLPRSIGCAANPQAVCSSPCVTSLSSQVNRKTTVTSNTKICYTSLS